MTLVILWLLYPFVYIWQSQCYTTHVAIYTNTPEYYTNTPEYYTNTPEYYTNTPEYYTNTPEYYINTPEHDTVAIVDHQTHSVAINSAVHSTD